MDEAINWVILEDKNKKEAEDNVKVAIKILKDWEKTLFPRLEKGFKSLPAQARVNLYAQMIEIINNVSNVPDYIKAGVLFNSAVFRNLVKSNQVISADFSSMPEKPPTYVG